MLQNLPIKETNQVPPDNQSSLICSKHNQKYEYISPTEKQLYCQECKNQLSIQQVSSGPILTFQQAQDVMKKQNTQLVAALETQFEICQKESKPKVLILNNQSIFKMNYDTNQGLQIIKRAEEEILLSIQNYFKELRKNYEIMSLSYPCQENQEFLANQIKTTLLKIQEWQKASVAGQLTCEQLLNYFTADYQQTTTNYKAIVNSFSDKSSASNKQPPEVFIDKKCLHNVDQILSDYVQTYISIGKAQPLEELNLMNSKAQASMLATFHPPNLIVYDINSAKTNTYKQSGNFPLSSSLIVTPTNTIYISGGVFENGALSNTFYKTSDSNQTLQQKSNMIVKRAGHSMCYLNKEIYVIGGVSNDHCQTKLCEKFSETTEKWTRIAKLQNPRSRVGLVVDEKNNQIYAFFGFASHSTINSIERYEVSSNQWILIQIKNQFQWQATGASAACYLNQSEILIFGGFAEQNEQCAFQNNLLIYNLESNSIFKLNKLIPIDYINSNSSPAIVNNEKIFAIGCFSGCKQGDMSCLQNTDYLIEIDKKMMPTITTLFVSEEPQKLNANTFEQAPKPAEIPKPVEMSNPAQQPNQSVQQQNSPAKQLNQTVQQPNQTIQLQQQQPNQPIQQQQQQQQQPNQPIQQYQQPNQPIQQQQQQNQPMQSQMEQAKNEKIPQNSPEKKK